MPDGTEPGRTGPEQADLGSSGSGPGKGQGAASPSPGAPLGSPSDMPQGTEMPGLPGVTPPPARPRSRGWIWFVLVILLLSCLVSTIQAAGIGMVARPFARPSIVADQYYTAVRSQDYARAYSYLAPTLTASLSQPAFIQQAQARDATEGTVSSYSLAPDLPNNPQRVNVTVNRSMAGTYTAHLEVRQQGKAWQIVSFDRI